VATSAVLAASTLCAPLIDGPPRLLEPVHRSSAAIQLADADGRVRMCVTTPDAVRLPHAVIVTSLPRRSSPVVVGDGAVCADDRRTGVGRWFEPARPEFPSLRRQLAPEAVAAFVRTWSVAIGRGEGLTPYADDVVCGSLVLLHAAGHPAAHQVAAALEHVELERRTTATSAALLRLAADGYCVDALADQLAALADEPAAVDEAAPATARLLAVGHTSGAGLLAGVQVLLGPAGDEAAA